MLNGISGPTKTSASQIIVQSTTDKPQQENAKTTPVLVGHMPQPVILEVLMLSLLEIAMLWRWSETHSLVLGGCKEHSCDRKEWVEKYSRCRVYPTKYI